ncbi:hypothetical protein N7454_004472 [Penicillium verhagenii]|nr:hypothetical protein N7454_004472 [Penicillium verhagenii]
MQDRPLGATSEISRPSSTKKVSVDDFKASLPFLHDVFAEGLGLYDKYEYFGPGTEELVAEAAAVALGRLSTIEDYLEKHPFQLP